MRIFIHRRLIAPVALGVERLVDIGLKIRFFRKIGECKSFLVDSRVPLMGIEIMEVTVNKILMFFVINITLY
jgi:hypothetical protein